MDMLRTVGIFLGNAGGGFCFVFCMVFARFYAMFPRAFVSLTDLLGSIPLSSPPPDQQDLHRLTGANYGAAGFGGVPPLLFPCLFFFFLFCVLSLSLFLLFWVAGPGPLSFPPPLSCQAPLSTGRLR